MTECPECHGALRKVYGAVGIVLKGSGFYKTDSRAAAGASNGNERQGRDKGDKDKESSSSSRRHGQGIEGQTSSSSSTSESSSPKSDGGSKDAKPAAAGRYLIRSLAAELHVGDRQGLTRR